jgi:hypothetical protein
MRGRSKVALSCLAVLGLLIVAGIVGFVLLAYSLDDPIDGWQEGPRTTVTRPAP